MALIRDLLGGEMTLLMLVALLGRHLTGEVPGGDGVDAHADLLELRGHELGEVHGGGFGRVVGEVALCVSDQAGHGRGRDDARGESLERSAGFQCGLEEGEEGDGGEVDACDVGVEGRLPVCYAFLLPELLLQVAGVCFVRLGFGAGDPGVAHEHVDGPRGMMEPPRSVEGSWDLAAFSSASTRHIVGHAEQLVGVEGVSVCHFLQVACFDNPLRLLCIFERK
ncbi:NAD(P)-binding protein [Hortaea werneckii]|nr:NAD(P)-binding protein [Hortaea werneckii]